VSDTLYLDRKAAAKACGVSPDYITKAIKAGKLRAKRSGKNEDGDPVGKYLVSRVALEEWFSGLEDA